MSELEPVLSIVVIMVSDTATGRGNTTHLVQCLQSLEQQHDAPPMEVLVPHYPGVGGLTDAIRRFPQVRFLACDDLQTYAGLPGSREHHNELRARGIAQARGEIIALIEDHGCAETNWCQRMVQAHSRPFAAVGGAIENAAPASLNRAVHLCDFYLYQNPVPDGPSALVSDANVSYKRSALEKVRPVWHDVFHEIAVNNALREHGESLALSPAIVVFQLRQNLRMGPALHERFVWGRSFAADRTRQASASTRMVYAALSPFLPALLVLRMARVSAGRGRLRPFLRVLPITMMLTSSWSLGELAGYLTGRAR